ncbi:ATP-NAD kinase-like domain-containing protein [Ochromonadaceae sp. CCMP2298]|nr:ATP-NAD kinase-like domain-containing protein [Ochromonadaceae sp. CCMP2298]
MVEISRGHKVYKYSTLNWTFDADAVPATHSPLLCFVNSLSGGQQGEHVKRQLRSLLHPFQVVDVSEMDPIISLRLFAQLAQYRVLVCGGDGTVGWVLDAIQTAHRESGNRESGKSLPPVGILPIGTGNDLSISLGWGHTFRGGGVARALEGVRRARRGKGDTEGDTGAAVAAAGGVSRTFQNYLGVGVDAMVVYRFHAMRASAPELFFHRWMNKIFYGWMGFSQIFSRSFEDFGTQVTLRVDGRLVPLPPGTQGVVVLNIRSYGGGSKLFRPVSISDGLFEVVAVRGSFELARVKMGLADVQRIAQGSSLSLTISHPTTMQADGEPWVQQPCVVTVGAGEQACMLEAELPAKFFDHLDDLGSEGGSEEGAVGAGAGRAGGDVPQT